MTVVEHLCNGFSLKCDPEYFPHIQSGKMNFINLKLDQDYHVDDTLLIKEFDSKTQSFTGRITTRRITHILRSYPADGFGILGLSPLIYL